MYRRASEDTDFAALCYSLKVAEEQFNLCLDYMASGWPKKTRDSIPSLIIKGEGVLVDGKDIARGYYWVKLPPHDKRALILGMLTDCCQSYGDHSSECVEDAVTRSDNGLYVLLKQKRKTGAPSPLIEGEINDTDFELIGQSYVWRSQFGNICLDSIECLTNSVPNDVLKKIMTDFATTLFHEDSTIKRVHVGTGGRTPPGLFDKAPFIEDMRQGFSYGDARHQYCIASKSTMNETETLALKALYYDTRPPGFYQCVMRWSDYIDDKKSFIDELTILLREHPSVVQKLTSQEVILNLFVDGQPPKVRDLTPRSFKELSAHDLVPGTPLIQLLWNELPLELACEVFYLLPEERRLTFLKNVTVRLAPRRTMILLGFYLSYDLKGLSDLIAALPADDIWTLLQIKFSNFKRNILQEIIETEQREKTDSDTFQIVFDLYPSAEERLTAIRYQDHLKSSTLCHAIEQPFSRFIPMLMEFPPSERLEALLIEGHNGLTVLDSVAHYSERIDNSHLLRAIFEQLPVTDQLTAAESLLKRSSGLMGLVRIILEELPEAVFFTLLTQQQTIDDCRKYFHVIQSTLVAWMDQPFPTEYPLKELIKEAKSFDEMQPLISELHSDYMAAQEQKATASNPHLFFQKSNKEDTQDPLSDELTNKPQQSR